MPDLTRCEKCGASIGSGALSGLCPNCLLRAALDAGTDTLGPAELPLFPKLRHFGDYELLEEIARGGMGVVYRARQLSLDRTVALKMMRPGLLATEDEVRRFRAEAKLAGALQHPNIVAVHEVGELDGLHYFSMDYVEGMSLAAMVREQPLQPKLAARYVRSIAEAIHYAHLKGTLHRDLKPSNVVVDLMDQPRVTDFGLARPIHVETGMTVTGAVMGTPAYMSPEQAAGKRDQLGVASDIYSLGAILFELLTGRPPFQGATMHETVKAVLEQDAPSPREWNAAAPRDLATICRKCLEKDPRRRYGSAEELAADLGRFVNGEPIHARPVSAATRAWRWCRRNPWPLTAVAAVTLLALVAAQWALLSRKGGTARAPSPPAGGPAMERATPGSLVAAPPPAESLGRNAAQPPGDSAADIGFAAPHPAPLDLSRGFRVAVVAGPGDTGDGGPATHGWLPHPEMTAADVAGNLYIADSGCHCIRKVGPDGIITRVAGTGEMGISPDGALAIEARLNIRYPLGFAVNPAGEVYFAEYDDCRVRKVDSTGRLSTVAGTGTCGFGGDGGTAVKAPLSAPRSLATGPGGKLYICDAGNNRIRVVDADGVIHTVAGNGGSGTAGDGGPALAAELQASFHIAADTLGNVFFSGPCRTRAISKDGIIRTVAGSGTCGFSGDGGPATAAQIGNAFALATDGAGNLYVGDGPRIRKIGTDGIIRTVAGNGRQGYTPDGLPALEAPFFRIFSMGASPASDLYVVEVPGKRILKIGGDGIVRAVAGSPEIPDNVTAGQARLSGPFSAAAGPDGSIFISDFYNHSVLRLGSDGIVRKVAGGPNLEGDLFSSLAPRGIAVDSAGNAFIGDQSCACVLKRSPDGVIARVAGNGVAGYTGDGGPALRAQLTLPLGIGLDGTGNLYIADGQVIRRVTPDGIITTVVGRIQGYSGDGGPAKDALLNGVSGVAVDRRGNLLIADSMNYRVRRVTPDGIISTIAGNGQRGHVGEGGPATEASIGPPVTVTADPAGTVFFSDPDFHSVWMVASDGVLRKAAELPHPLSVSASPDGSLIVADDWNNRVYALTRQQ